MVYIILFYASDIVTQKLEFVRAIKYSIYRSENVIIAGNLYNRIVTKYGWECVNYTEGSCIYCIQH